MSLASFLMKAKDFLEIPLLPLLAALLLVLFSLEALLQQLLRVRVLLANLVGRSARRVENRPSVVVVKSTSTPEQPAKDETRPQEESG